MGANVSTNHLISFGGNQVAYGLRNNTKNYLEKWVNQGNSYGVKTNAELQLIRCEPYSPPNLKFNNNLVQPFIRIKTKDIKWFMWTRLHMIWQQLAQGKSGYELKTSTEGNKDGILQENGREAYNHDLLLQINPQLLGLEE